jgi:type VI secretion system FHA domain protein
MYLTLEVVSPQAASLGADRRRVVGERGLTIGRIPGNDWIIPDPYISKQHARISYANGTFYVEGLGRNAIAIGSPGNTLPGNRRQALKSGDRLFIDQYEMLVTAQQGDPPGMSVADDPFAVLAPGAPGSPADSFSRATIPDKWNPLGEFGDTGVVDPLEVLGGNPRAAEPDPLPPLNIHGSSVIADHFEPPPVPSPGGGSPFDLLGPAADPEPRRMAVPSPSGIPDNWGDRTNLNNPPLRPEASRPTPRPVTPPRSARAPSREAVALKPPTPDPIPRQVPVRRPNIPDPRVAPEMRPRANPDNRAITPSPAPEIPNRQPSALAGWPAAPPGQGVGADLAELMRGAGLSGQEMSPDMVQDLGKVLRVVVNGVMDVLRARAEIKSQFRLPTTRIQSVENNPLKHSPNLEHALHTLLVERNPGFLSPVQAFEDAFADIRNHQMAMLEGLRVAFDSMLESFDPKELEKEFERAPKRGFGSARSKFWDLYAERFTGLGDDSDATFRKLFGDVFAAAYEKQLARLKALGRNNGKS